MGKLIVVRHVLDRVDLGYGFIVWVPNGLDFFDPPRPLGEAWEPYGGGDAMGLVPALYPAWVETGIFHDGDGLVELGIIEEDRLPAWKEWRQLGIVRSLQLLKLN